MEAYLFEWLNLLGRWVHMITGIAWIGASFYFFVIMPGQRALVEAHPDLAGRAVVCGELTAESTTEQASAGVDQCTPEEFARFKHFNEAYKDKFGFPFVMAVKGSNRREILAAFEERLQNDADTEFRRALTEINKIARLRLEVMTSGE